MEREKCRENTRGKAEEGRQVRVVGRRDGGWERRKKQGGLVFLVVDGRSLLAAEMVVCHYYNVEIREEEYPIGN